MCQTIDDRLIFTYSRKSLITAAMFNEQTIQWQRHLANENSYVIYEN